MQQYLRGLLKREVIGGWREHREERRTITRKGMREIMRERANVLERKAPKKEEERSRNREMTKERRGKEEKKRAKRMLEGKKRGQLGTEKRESKRQ